MQFGWMTYELYLELRHLNNVHYATKQQVAGSIPDGVIGIFQ